MCKNSVTGFVIVDKQEAEDRGTVLCEMLNSLIEVLVDVPIL